MTLGDHSTAPRRAMSDLVLILMPVCGLVVMLTGLSQVAGPRVHYKGSSPTPGARLPNLPQAVTVWFDHPIDPGAQLYVEYARPADAHAGRPRRVLATALGPDPVNPLRTSLRVSIPAPARPGLYVVRWEARAHRGPEMFGALVFGAAGDTLRRVNASVVEWVHTTHRGGWPAVFGGALWILASPFLFWMSRRLRNEKSEDPPSQPDPRGTWGEPPDA